MIVMLAVRASSSRTSARSLVGTLALIFRITTFGRVAASGGGSVELAVRPLRAHKSSRWNHPSSLLLSKTMAVSLLGRRRVAMALALSIILAVASFTRLTRAGARIRCSGGISLDLRIASGPGGAGGMRGETTCGATCGAGRASLRGRSRRPRCWRATGRQASCRRHRRRLG